MDINQFWDIMDEAKEIADDDWEDMEEPLINILSELEIQDLMIWKQIFDEYQRLSYKNKLWAAAYIINGGCSDDGFDYFRAWLIAQGAEVFFQALKEPDSLAGTPVCEEDVEFEALLSVPAIAYFKAMGMENRDYNRFYEELQKYQLSGKIKKEMVCGIEYAADIDAQWDEEEDLSDLLPKLCRKFEWE